MMDLELYAYHAQREREAAFSQPDFEHRAAWAKGVAALRSRVRRQPREHWNGRREQQTEAAFFRY